MTARLTNNARRFGSMQSSGTRQVAARLSRVARFLFILFATIFVVIQSQRGLIVRNYLMLGAALTALASCAPFPYTETPLATNFPTSKQPKLQAAHHWDVIADDLAKTLADTLAKGSVCVAPAGGCPSIFVEPIQPRTAFGQAFHNQFVSHLVQRGLNVVTSGPADITVSLDMQAVRFSPDRKQHTGAMRSTQSYAGVVAGAAVADVYELSLAEFAEGPTPQVELVVTVSATRGGRFLARKTNAYYIADTDAALYTPPPSSPPLHPIRVVGDAGGTAK